MGYGRWTRKSFESYSVKMGRSVAADGNLDSRYGEQELFRSRYLDPKLDPRGVTRECCDSAEHPNTIPVILALDVTGSMGAASAEVAKRLSGIMTDLYDRIEDVEFMVMGIGDLAYDRAPLQVSQFESDIRIAEQLDKIWLEHGGGGNAYESYTAAWYFALHHTKLDCEKRGRKGVLITLGDEPLNPYLDADRLSALTGDQVRRDVETRELYEQVSKKYDVYHLAVDDKPTACRYYWDRIERTFGSVLPDGRLRRTTLDDLARNITDVICEASGAVYGGRRAARGANA